MRFYTREIIIFLFPDDWIQMYCISYWLKRFKLSNLR